MTENDVRGIHPDEGDLVRLIDGELEPDTTGAIEQHIATCEACAIDLEILRQTTKSFGGELANDALEVPNVGLRTPARRRSISVPMKVAAGLVILIPLSATLRPVRAFMSSGWGAVVEVLGFSRAEPVPQPTGSVSMPSPGAVVSFVPRGSSLIIEVTAWQTAGAIHLEVGAAATASAQILAPAESESITVMPNRGIKIGTTAASTSDYRVVVPSSLNLVAVVVEGVEVAEFEPTTGQESTSVPLTRRP